ncbi:hypothetical protein BVRB_2g045330 isoform B [Beta vulgaris subsp. vulgaris]|uniref:peptidyl-tRNA hydrolase n=1 Tax=Beta vulgaris subsp. vulgaris TaxID=3555 RepID=A0A0J8BEP8_BETVV|nr:hypothetical protein BVRB_2g045330 isoform B [Beta vulgaris subsp. vulgaris]
MEMLTLVRLSASISISIPKLRVVPLNLTGKARQRERRAKFVGFSIDGRSMSTDETTNLSVSDVGERKAEDEDVVVQYVVLRRDLIDKWPLGSVVTQGCHASVAAIWQHKDDSSTLRYCSPPHALDSMHKVTLEVKGETQLVNLSEKLNSAGILHKLWIEQPENFPTCLATKPYPKSVVSPFFRKLKLCK